MTCHVKVKSNQKPAYKYTASGKDAIEVAKLIWPYLGEVKRQQAINAGFKPNGQA